MSPDNPIQLLQKIVDKDERAFERLYDTFSGLVMALALRILRDRLKAEELVQDVFMHVWNKASSYDTTRGKPEAWLIMLTRSRAIDRIRSSQTQTRLTTSLDGDELVQNKNLESTDGFSADARMSLDGLVDKITKEQRKVLELAYYEGLTQSEIALKLSLPLGTAKTRIRDGLLHLRKILQNMETVSKS